MRVPDLTPTNEMNDLENSLDNSQYDNETRKPAKSKVSVYNSPNTMLMELIDLKRKTPVTMIEASRNLIALSDCFRPLEGPHSTQKPNRVPTTAAADDHLSIDQVSIDQSFQ